MKRNIFTFDEDDFHIALMHNYKQGKICIFALNEQSHTTGLTRTLSEKRRFILTDFEQTDQLDDGEYVIIQMTPQDFNYIRQEISRQFPNAKMKTIKKPRILRGLTRMR